MGVPTRILAAFVVELVLLVLLLLGFMTVVLFVPLVDELVPAIDLLMKGANLVGATNLGPGAVEVEFEVELVPAVELVPLFPDLLGLKERTGNRILVSVWVLG